MAVPSVLTDSYNALLTTTARRYLPRLRDNITRGNILLSWLNSRGRMRGEDGGDRIQIPLMYKLNDTVDAVQGYGIVNPTPQDGITSAFFEWREIAGTITISRREERQNSGSARLLSLFESKMKQLEMSLQESLNNALVCGRISTGVSSANGAFVARTGVLDPSAAFPLPLAALIDSDPTRSRTDIGNINGLTYPWWRNQVLESTATTFAGLRQEMTDMYTRCQKGVGGGPDLIVADRLGWTTFFNGLADKERYIRTDAKTVDVLGGAGGMSEGLAFFKATVVWDEVVPDVATNAETLDGVGTYTNSTMFFINSNAMEWIYDTESDMAMTPFVQPEDQLARSAKMVWMGAVGVNNRRKLGVLKGISQAIVA